ncbi:MAG: NAD(P)/FAD-dependent oxidoreductase [Clostridium perfringens]|nr:NAD(P)/FAD-dependent oxidoreductase [Clostridium perfringens]
MGSVFLEYDLVIIGGGPAGMACAISASENKVKKILLIEREEILGGELNQSIHCSFGKDIFGYNVTGSEYTEYFMSKIRQYNIELKLNTMVLNVKEDNKIYYVNPDEGMQCVSGKAIVLATGSREKFNCNIDIPVNKVAGIYTIGAAQRFINDQGYLPGKKIVILGSGDKEFLIARRLIVEGAKVIAVIEPSNNLKCKNDKSKKIIDAFNIPVRLNYDILDVTGDERVTGVIISDKKNNKENIECDALLISLNWNSESELVKEINLNINSDNDSIIVNDRFEASKKGIFACGNAIHCDELSDVCTKEGSYVGKIVKEYLYNN